jgi:branched-chain amino acid transport system substrate-binding protein
MKKINKLHQLIFFLCIITYQPILYPFFDTLNSITQYANSLDENPTKDNNDWLNPDYSSFHKTQLPNIFSDALAKIGIKKRQFWNARDFKKLVETIVKKRELLGNVDDFYIKMTPTPETRYVIWGSLHGAFHSLLRDLQDLKEKGVINDELKIIQPNYYFVFNGNVIDRSAFILETLTLVLRLMEENPEKVFYLKGDHENKELWHNFGLKRELEIRAHGFSNEKIPLSALINQFFNTLPLALYLISSEKNEIQALRISHYGSNEILELNEENYAGYLEQPQELTVDTYKLNFKKPATSKVDFKAIVRGKDRAINYELTDGLKTTDAEKGATTWTVFSSPTATFRAVLDFFYDVFVIITTKPKMDDWTIALYNRDVRTSSATFSKKRELGLVSGQPIAANNNSSISSNTKENSAVTALKKELAQCKTDLNTQQKKSTAPQSEKKKAEVKTAAEKKAPAKQPVKNEKQIAANEIDDNDEIKIGCLTDLTKGVAVYGKQQIDAFNLRFNAENKAGGVHGKKIKLIVEDHEYEPTLALQLTEKMIAEYNIEIILGFIGTAPLNAVLPLVKEDKLLMLFPNATPDSPSPENLIYLRASFNDETNALLNYAVNELGRKKIAIFYQNDAYGISQRDAARKKLKALGIKDWAEGSYERNTVNVAEAAEKIEAFEPTAILGLGVNNASVALINSLNITKLANTAFLGNSFMGNEFINFMKEKGLSLVLSQILPDPITSTLPIAQEYVKIMQQNNLVDQISFFHFENFIAADFLIYILQHIEGAITKEKIIAYVEDIKDLDYKGLKLNFDHKHRVLLRSVWIKPADSDTWQEQKL